MVDAPRSARRASLGVREAIAAHLNGGADTSSSAAPASAKGSTKKRSAAPAAAPAAKKVRRGYAMPPFVHIRAETRDWGLLPRRRQ